jgi:hypothetical protein
MCVLADPARAVRLEPGGHIPRTLDSRDASHGDRERGDSTLG